MPANCTTTTDSDAGERVVLRHHPGFTEHSVGYNAETGQSVHLIATLDHKSKSLRRRDGRSERRRRENRGAEGVGLGEGVSPPQSTRGPGGAS